LAKVKQIIGRKEFISLVDFNLNGVEAKIDTGAYTSSLHCHKIREEKIGERTILKCELFDPKHINFNNRPFNFDKYSIAKVRSSNGTIQKRFKIKIKVKFETKVYLVEFTLTNRSKMRSPVLIGRKVLKGKFIVDVSKKYLLNSNIKNGEKNENSNIIKKF
jgi:hypothetical protein